MKITINGGHCPNLDSGAVSPNGLQEANVVKIMMGKTANYLRAVGHEVMEVQENELYQITDASNTFGAELFVSIHCNSAGNREAKGTETFCYEIGGEGEKLACAIQSQIVTSLETVNRGIKTDHFYVLRNTNCPAVLVETAFISNSEDEALLSNESTIDQFAAAIARGITNYIGGM